MPNTVRRPTFRQLEGFHAVVAGGSIKAGAAALSVSQAAMSKLMKSLEDDLGVPLFLGKRGGLRVSDVGRAVFAQAEVLFKSLSGVSELVQQLQNQQAGRVRIASVSMLSVQFLPALIAAYVKEHPRVEVELETFSSKEVVHLVRSGQFDFGFLSPPVETRGVEFVRSYRLRSMLITPPVTEFEDGAPVVPAMLAGKPFVSLASSSLTRNRIDELFSALNIDRQMSLSARSPASVSSFVLNGCGNAIVDPFTAQEHVRRGGRAFDFEPAIPTTFLWVRAPQGGFRPIEEEMQRELEMRLTRYEPFAAGDTHA